MVNGLRVFGMVVPGKGAILMVNSLNGMMAFGRMVSFLQDYGKTVFGNVENFSV